MAEKLTNGHDEQPATALPGGSGFCPHCRQPLTLTIEQVAEILLCSVDTVRRVPENKLPRYRKGKRNAYFPEDVLDYLRKYPASRNDNTRPAPHPRDKLAPRNPGVLNLKPVDMPGRSPRRTS